MFTGAVKKENGAWHHSPAWGMLLFSATISFTVFDLNNEYAIDSHDFLSMGKSTPFDGKSVYGKCRLTMFKGDAVWIENSTER